VKGRERAQALDAHLDRPLRRGHRREGRPERPDAFDRRLAEERQREVQVGLRDDAQGGRRSP
jgi:hypothetical protein